MAYLKGGTYVDGSLYVKESLLVNTITTPEGSLPHIPNVVSGDGEDTYPDFKDHLVIFEDNEGAITRSPIQVLGDGKTIAISIEDGSVTMTLASNGSTIKFEKDAIELTSSRAIKLDDSNDRRWVFS